MKGIYFRRLEEHYSAAYPEYNSTDKHEGIYIPDRQVILCRPISFVPKRMFNDLPDFREFTICDNPQWMQDLTKCLKFELELNCRAHYEAVTEHEYKDEQIDQMIALATKIKEDRTTLESLTQELLKRA